ncbi:MAG: ATP-binding protein [Thermoanaerobaculum sp.]|nr:ATP-binding protein [Thermoanaerobaculum sp.]
MIGRMVWHPINGLGLLVALRGWGANEQALVAFADGTSRWVPFRDLSFDPPDEIDKVPPKPNGTCYRVKRKVIEAFRLGVVPADSVEDFTFGRERELQTLKEWLTDPEARVLQLVGPYGSGKSHLLDYMYWYALKNGFAVARVELDPQEAPLYKPKRIYSRLARSFRFPQKNRLGDLRDFLTLPPVKLQFAHHMYFRALYEYEDSYSANIPWEWILGAEGLLRPFTWKYRNEYFICQTCSNVPALYETSTALNVYSYLLSSLGWAAKQCVGLHGLVCLFDEAETMAVASHRDQVEKGARTLSALICAAHDGKAPYKFWSNGLYRGPYTIDVPFLYDTSSGLKLLLAFPERCQSHKLLQLQPCLSLSQLSESALQCLLGKIIACYREVYAFPDGQLPENLIFHRIYASHRPLRLFVKGAVEALDLLRHYPHRDPEQLLQ